MKNDFKFYEQGYVPDEGEIYFSERIQGKKEKRNGVLILFLFIGVLASFIIFLIYIFKLVFL